MKKKKNPLAAAYDSFAESLEKAYESIVAIIKHGIDKLLGR